MLPQLDVDLIKRAQRGEQAAFATIVDTYETIVRNYILRMVGDFELAEDLTQEVFIRVFRALPLYAHRAQFTTWLFQVAKHLVVDHVRARTRRPDTIELEQAPAATHAISDAPVEQAELIGAIWAAIDALQPELRAPLLLREITGLAYDEIADTLDITVATVKWRIHAARGHVQLTLAKDGFGGSIGATGLVTQTDELADRRARGRRLPGPRATTGTALHAAS
jgi:RNA polymerase sigma-70 factor (ECF subfamily)